MNYNKNFFITDLIWDNLDDNDIIHYAFESYYSIYPESDNIFSLSEKGIAINISTFLNVILFDELTKIIFFLHNYKTIILINDVLFIENFVINDYLNKRIRQIYSYLIKNLNNSIVYLKI